MARGIAGRAAVYARSFAGLGANARRLLVATICLWVGIGVAAVLFNLYLVAIGYNVAFLGTLAAVSTVGQAAASPLLSRVARLRPARDLMLAAVILVAAGIAASAIVTQAALLLALTALQGVGVAVAAILASPFMMEQASASQRVHLFSAYTAATNVGTMIGSLICGALPVVTGLIPALRGQAVADDRLGLLVGAAITGAGAWFLGRITAETVPEENGLIPAALGGEPDPDELRADMLAMMAATVCIALSLGGIYSLFNVYFATVQHASASAIGLLYALSGVICTGGVLLGPIAARRGALPWLVILRGLSAPVLLLFWLHPPLAIAFGAYIGRNILGQITGTLENTFTMERVPAALRAPVASWRTFSFNVGWTASSLVAGLVVARFGFDPIFVAGAVLTLAGTLIWHGWFGRRVQPIRYPLRTGGGEP